MKVYIYTRKSDHPIGWVDDNGYVYLAFGPTKIASVDRGNVHQHRPVFGRGKKVGSVNGSGNLYKRGVFWHRIGSVDGRGNVYKSRWLWRGKRIGRIKPFQVRGPLRLYAFGAALVLLLLTDDS